MRRIAIVALVAAAGCNKTTELDPGPSDRYYFPTGAAVTADGRLVVASSNFDLRYAEDDGGSVISVDPLQEPAPGLAALLGTVNVQSLGGQLALADPATCTAIPDPAAGAVAVLPVRGANLVYRLRVAADGTVSCADCAIPIGTTNHVDPFNVGIACGPGIARAFVGFLNNVGLGLVAQVNLVDGAVQQFAVDAGQVRGFAYDPTRERLYMTHTVIAGTTELRWVDLGGKIPCAADPTQLCPCELDAADTSRLCAMGISVAGAVPNGLELRSIALSSGASDRPYRRAYVTARVYDPVLAAAAGGRNTDFDGRLLVMDLSETLGGRLDLAVVREIELGYGAGDVVLLPPRPGRPDVVAALAQDSGRLTIYDDESGEAVGIGADLEGPGATGAPLLGHVPFALAADPVVRAGVARLYVVSFQESYVTAIDVPLDDPASACLVAAGGGCASGPDTVRRIAGGVAP